MKRSLRHRLLANWRYKIASIFLASVLWYIVQGEELLEINRRLIISVETPEGFMLKGSNPLVKDVTLKGPRVLLGEWSHRPLEATIEVNRRQAQSGKPIRIFIGKDIIKDWSERINITVHDPYVSLVVDEQITRRVPVKEFLSGVPADDYMIEEVTIQPNALSVTGLKREVMRLRELRTEVIPVNGLRESKTFQAAIMTADLPGMTVAEDIVTVNVKIAEKRINRSFPRVPIEVVGSDFPTTVSPSHLTLRIQGTRGVLSFVKHSDLRAFVEMRGQAPGRYERDVQVRIPPGTALIETQPDRVTVHVGQAGDQNN